MTTPHQSQPEGEDHQMEEQDMLDADEAAEEIVPGDDDDHPMDSDPENEDGETEIQFQNDSIAHFDGHKDSVFSITVHPLNPSIVATGSGDDTVHIFSTESASPLLPASYNADPSGARESLASIAHLTGHKDSVVALAFSQPRGEYLVTAGMDGKLRAYTSPEVRSLAQGPYKYLAEVQEVEEIIWLAACPHPSYPNTFALGAKDGSVWVYTVEKSSSTPLQVVQAYYLHTAITTAGTWSPSGSLLASVAEDSSLFVYDVFGDAATANISSAGQALISLSPDDQRFVVDGGLYSIAFAPSGAFLATGGAEGIIRIIGLPLLHSPTNPSSKASSKTKAPKSKSTSSSNSSGNQTGQILASLQAQTDSIETLAFAPSPLNLLAAGSVDGSIAIFDTSANFAVRRLIRDAHEGLAVVQVSFAEDTKNTQSQSQTQVQGLKQAQAQTQAQGFILTSCGVDGVVRRWDTRRGLGNVSGEAAVAAQAMGLVGEWKGHRSDADITGVLGFVIADGKIVTAGDDGVSLVFDLAKH